MEKRGKNWKRRKLSYFELIYGDEYRAWSKLDLHDDRRLYCNMYELVIEAIKSLDDEPLAFVCCAMNKRINEYEVIMNGIIANFK